jgi:hypothetical protein
MFFRILSLVLLVVAVVVRANVCDDTDCVFNSGSCTNENVCNLRSANNPTGSNG